MSYKSAGAHSIVARYVGDRAFQSSQSRLAKVQALGIITSTVRSTFKATPTYTSVLALVVKGAPVGSAVVATCHGRGCPFAKSRTIVRRSSQQRSIDLTAAFANNRLALNAQLVVKIIRPNWIGRYYDFVVRSGRGPRVQIACLAPGASKPGVSCPA